MSDMTYQQAHDARYAAIIRLLPELEKFYRDIVSGVLVGIPCVEFINTYDELLFEARFFTSIDVDQCPSGTLLVIIPCVPSPFIQRLVVNESGMTEEEYLLFSFVRQKEDIEKHIMIQLQYGWKIRNNYE